MSTIVLDEDDLCRMVVMYNMLQATVSTYSMKCNAMLWCLQLDTHTKHTQMDPRVLFAPTYIGAHSLFPNFGTQGNIKLRVWLLLTN